MKALLNAGLRGLFAVYYRIKFWCLRPALKDETAAAVLYDSLLPDLVLRLFGARLGRNVRINRWLTLHQTGNDFSKLKIGDDVHIGKHVLIDLSGAVRIGDRVGIGMFSRLMTHEALGDTRLAADYPPQSGDLTIPDDCVVTAGSFVLFPTELRPGSLISCNSVVRGRFDRPAVLMGNPARIAKHLDEREVA